MIKKIKSNDAGKRRRHICKLALFSHGLVKFVLRMLIITEQITGET